MDGVQTAQRADRDGRRAGGWAIDALGLCRATLDSVANPALTIPFFLGPIHEGLPHVRAASPLGHTQFTPEATGRYTEAARSTPNGVATYWGGPFAAFYVADNGARRALVQESRLGVVDDHAASDLQWVSGGNRVMSTFPVFRPIDSAAYVSQRRFLLRRFHAGAARTMPTVAATTDTYLRDYVQTQQRAPRSLREVLTGLVLHGSSVLLGLGEGALDRPYFRDATFRDAMHRVARYGVTERRDEAFEAALRDLFEDLVRERFDEIAASDVSANLVRNLFDSLEIPFPSSFEGFLALPEADRHELAMNFASTGMGAMVHSTANTLDWAIARMLDTPGKYGELRSVMDAHADADLTRPDLYDKGGPLFPIAEWVLHNVALNPPFSHEFFQARRPITATLPGGLQVTVPEKAFVVVNYGACNRTNPLLASEGAFRDHLADTRTVGRFVADPEVASFGGSDVSQHNRHSRRCPGAKTSMYEQIVVMATLLRDYHVEVVEPMSCADNPAMHPLCARVNRGTVRLHRRDHGGTPHIGG